MLNNILNKTVSGKKLILSLSLSFLGNIILYNENIILKKEKSEMYLMYKKSINDYIRFVNEIKSK
jgi:hypothetical protein